MIMKENNLKWELDFINDSKKTTGTIWRNRKYEIFKEESITSEGVDVSFTIPKIKRSFDTFKELCEYLKLDNK